VTTEPNHLTTEQMLTAGLSPRQLEYWVGRGYLRPETASPGTGFPRRWPPTEQQIAHLMVRLTHAGLIPGVAASAARVAIEHGLTEIVLSDGIVVGVRDAA
jgi:hypothetical protein